ncbi:tetratricopeptide repeat protein [Actinacidiphila sp. bgisy145]|uniref:tetratricopeptide repeat protein n=1 Tax=Actinacidiphila sp. bgisy145 TaxID=3413792 RepID=UPI003EB8F44F
MAPPATPPPDTGGDRQVVQVESGFGYGVVGADLHVLPDRGPVYLLGEHRAIAQPDPHWLLAQPSRLLDARFRLVEFTGRAREQAELAAWRDADGPRLAARWLHGPGGQGKTRLAAEFAEQSAAAGWKVVSVTHGPGTAAPPPGSHTLEPGAAPGILLVVDYADRWPLTHLTWLFSNKLLHRDLPTRLLLLARSLHPWPPIRAALTELQARTDACLLRPIGDSGDGGGGNSDSGYDGGPGGSGTDAAADAARRRMFTVARDCFAHRYGVRDPTAVEPPGPLRHADFGLVLTLHMAALAAVDSHVRGGRPPTDPAGLSAYLLDRELRRWTQLFENQVEGLDFRTPPEDMARVVFAAALTGPTARPRAKDIVRGLDLELPPGRVLDDHAACYPPAEPGAALEPLYPDRLAEDFIALTLPGHTTTGHPARSWAFPVAQALAQALGRAAPDGSPPGHIGRTITFLTAAAGRWPHVTAHLSQILAADPGLALEAGGPALTALAGLDLDTGLLEALAARFPDRHVDLDTGIASVAAALARRYPATTHPHARADAHFTLVYRLNDAGLHQEALAASQEAVRLYERLAGTDPAGYEIALARALHNHGHVLGRMGQLREGLAATEQAVAVYRRRTARGALARLLRSRRPGPYDADLATCLLSLGSRLAEVGRGEEALTVTEEAVAVRRRLAAFDPAAADEDLADSLANLGIYLSGVGRGEEALGPAQEAVDVYRRLAARDPQAYEPNFASFLSNFALHLIYADRAREALGPSEEAVALYRRLAASNPHAFEDGLARALHNHGLALADTDQEAQALAVTREAVEWYRAAGARSPAAVEPELGAALTLFAQVRAGAGREQDDALRAAEEAVARYRRLTEETPGAFDDRLRNAVRAAARVLDGLGRTREAAELRRAHGIDEGTGGGSGGGSAPGG